MENILISGCSYTYKADWPATLFPNCNITNLARSGAGNKYIADSIINDIDLKNPPDKVFILFSTIDRFDLTVETTKFTTEFAKKWKYFGQIGNVTYIFSGGDKWHQNFTQNYKNIASSTWPKVTTVEQWLQLPTQTRKECVDRGLFEDVEWSLEQLVHHSMMLQYLNPSTDLLAKYTCDSVDHCLNFLKLHRIPYNFSFIMNVFDCMYKHNYNCIDRSKMNIRDHSGYVDFTPFEYALKHDYLAEDNFHVTTKGMENWAKIVQNRLT